MINKIDDGSASLSFPDFNLLIREKAKEVDPETHFNRNITIRRVWALGLLTGNSGLAKPIYLDHMVSGLWLEKVQ